MASSLETNKLIAAILTAGVIASGAGVTSRILYHADEPEETAYQIAVADEGAGDGGEGNEGEPPLGVLLAGADAGAGESASRACAACHSFDEGGANKIGPALHGVVGREIAEVGDFAYSDALAEKEGAWDYEALDGFLADPSGWAPGTKMAYAGIRSGEDRADMILYLRSISPDAPPLPEPEEAQVAEAAAGEGEGETGDGGAAEGAAGGGVIAMIADADPAAGEAAARACAACHSFDEGGPTKIGPNLYNVVGREIAAADDFAYSDALAGMDGAWDYEALEGFLADPRGWAPGTKMAYAGVKREQQLAELIAYLRSISPDAPPLPEGDDAAQGAGGGGDEQQAQGQEGEQQAAATGSAGQAETSGEQQQAAEAAEGSEQQASDQGAGGEQQQAAAADQPATDGQAAGTAQQGSSGGAEQQQAAVQEEEAPAAGSGGQNGGAAAEGAVAMVAAADPGAGEKAARKCVACHSFDEGGPNKIGPNLHGVVGRDIASVEGFNYSGALKDKEGSWDYAALDAFLEDPRGWAKGTRMAFAGVKTEQERAELLAYMRSISPDAPPPPGQ